MITPETYSEQVCVVISDESVAEDEVRRRLGETVPVHMTRWENRDYLTAIRNLRPRVIVVVSSVDQVATDSADLIACLMERYEPTVASLTIAESNGSTGQLILHQLGAGTLAEIHALDDLQFD